MLSNVKKIFSSTATIVGIIIVTVAATIIYLNFSDKNENVSVVIDKTVVIKEVNKLNKLETVNEVLQRDVEITLDLGGFSLFGKTLLENKRTQKISIVGTVTAGIDLSKITEDDVILSDDKKTLTLKLPEPEILHVGILEGETDLLKDDYTILFALSNLSKEQKRQVNEFLLKQAIKQGKVALIDGSCANDILQKANENAKAALAEGPFGNILFDSIEVDTTDPASCNYDELTALESSK